MKKTDKRKPELVRVTVREVKAKEPLAEVYEFKKTNVYLILLNKPKIISSSFSDRNAMAIQIQDLLTKHGISAIYGTLDDENEIKVLELKS